MQLSPSASDLPTTTAGRVDTAKQIALVGYNLAKDSAGMPPRYGFTMTSIQKVGINPSSTFETPLAVYAYPVTPMMVSNLTGGKNLDIAFAMPEIADEMRAQVEALYGKKSGPVPIADAPVTLSFHQDSRGGFYVAGEHPGVARVGYISVLPFWDDQTLDGVDLPRIAMKGRKDVEIYTVDTAKLDKLFRSEGLGTQMYKFLIANLSAKNIALVPAEWTRDPDDAEARDLPVGGRGTSHAALRVWKGLEVPAFYPEWKANDFKVWRSIRRRGWKKGATRVPVEEEPVMDALESEMTAQIESMDDKSVETSPLYERLMRRWL